MANIEKRLILIVDTHKKHLEQVTQALISSYDIAAFENSEEAKKFLREHSPTLILLGENIQPSGLLNLIKEIKEDEKTASIPVITIIDTEKNFSLTVEAEQAGASTYIKKPYLRSTLINTISRYLNVEVEKEWDVLPETPKAALKKSVAIFNDIADVLLSGETVQFKNIKENCEPLIEAIESNNFASILDGVRMHDDYTYAHSMRVATLLSLLGHAAGFKKDEQLLLASGGLLHDVGKMMIPHNILNKPGKLSDEEFEIMKGHVPETMKYLYRSENIPKGVLIIAEQHHEKIDGTGYPNGLKGSELNELARMSAVVDVFSALTDRRIYKPPMEAAKAMDIMSEEMTHHLDQNYVKMFRKILMDSDIL